MNSGCHRRAGLVCIGLALLLSVYSARLIHLQVAKHDEYSRLAADKTARKKIIPAQRGSVTDRNGEPLASNLPVYTVVVDGSLVEDREKLADAISSHLDLPRAEVAERIASSRQYIVMQRRVSAEKVESLKLDLAEARLKGVRFEYDAVRHYPSETLLGHVIGYLDHEGHGIQGVEKMAEPYLRGEDGFTYTARDRTGAEIVAYRGLQRPPRDGMTVALTIDLDLQDIVERELDTAFETLKPHMATAVFLDPKTGEILAMASRPVFNPNESNTAPVEVTKNRAIIEQYEPGSTFKMVVIAAALNEKAVKPETIFYCENGRFSYAGKTLNDAHPYGKLSVHDILVKSSNIGCAKVAMLLGADTFHEYIRRFGFGERTGIGLPGEIGGTVRPRHRWTPLSITRVPMGHEIAVTPLQIAMCTSVIANGGRMMLPQLIHSVRDADGAEVLSFKPHMLRQVITPETAAEVASAMEEVVSDRGTARRAAIDGFKVAGKTGTAQRVDPKGGYAPGKYVVSFAGFFPADNPRIAGIVVVDDARTPESMNYGGTVAAPIFSRIGEAMARHLDLQPDTTTPGGATVALVPFGQEMN